MKLFKKTKGTEMTKVVSIFLTIIFSLFLSGLLQAQQATTTKSSVGIYDELLSIIFTDLDSNEEDTSAVFTLAKFNNKYWGVPTDATGRGYIAGSPPDTVYFPITDHYPFPMQYEGNQVRDSLSVTVYVDGSFDQTTWFAVDTLISAYTDTGTVAQKTVDFNNKKFPYYRSRGKTSADNGINATLALLIHLYQKE